MDDQSDSQQQPQTIYVDDYGRPLTTEPAVAPFITQEQENIIKYQLETFPDIVRLMRVFKGELYDPDNQKWLKGTKPMLSEEGIAEVTSFVLEGKNILLSNYDKRTLYMTIRAMLNTLTRMIYNNKKRYGLEDTATADTIIDIVFVHLQAMYLSAHEGDMRKYFQKQIRESHSYVSNAPSQEQKKRFWFV